MPWLRGGKYLMGSWTIEYRGKTWIGLGWAIFNLIAGLVIGAVLTVTLMAILL